MEINPNLTRSDYYSQLEIRYANWCEREEDEESQRLDSFAIRGDGSMVCFDGHGYFLLMWTGPGTIGDEHVPNLIQAVDPKTGYKTPVYCEPTWIAGYYDTVRDS